MSYALVCAVVLGATALVCGILVPCLPRPRRHVLLMGVTALVIGALTAVFDSLMIAVGLFTYVEEHLLGIRVGLAPVEDFAYVLLVATLLPTLWMWRRGRRAGREDAR